MLRLIVLSVLFVSLNVHAKTIFKGVSNSGNHCVVSLNPANDNVSFNSVGTGFGFYASTQEIDSMVKKGHQKILLEGEDSNLKAALTLHYNKAGELVSAFYTQKNFMKVKRLNCTQLAKNETTRN
ncbi:MAG: hypothetical protein ACLGGX_00495 [Bdellovibrionia bacterium]